MLLEGQCTLLYMTHTSAIVAPWTSNKGTFALGAVQLVIKIAVAGVDLGLYEGEMGGGGSRSCYQCFKCGFNPSASPPFFFSPTKLAVCVGEEQPQHIPLPCLLLIVSLKSPGVKSSSATPLLGGWSQPGTAAVIVVGRCPLPPCLPVAPRESLPAPWCSHCPRLSPAQPPCSPAGAGHKLFSPPREWTHW